MSFDLENISKELFADGASSAKKQIELASEDKYDV
jgi:hypothetical protein